MASVFSSLCSLSKCHPCFVYVKIMCIFVAICRAELFWHAFGYINSVWLQYLLQRNEIKNKIKK